MTAVSEAADELKLPPEKAAAPASSPASAAARQDVLPLFFRSIEALDSNRHRGLKRRGREHYKFALGSNAIPLGYSEIQKASQEFPVVIAGDGSTLHVVALVGLTADTNLYVGSDGRWLGRYVPAYLRAYPFAFAKIPDQAPGTYTVAIDPQSSELNTTEGSPLFSDAGEQTAYLSQVIEFLRHYDAQAELARKFARRLSDMGLLRSVNADVRLRAGGRFSLTGLQVVERTALRALPNESRMELYDSEWLEAVYHHLASLTTFSQLVDRLALRGNTKSS
jgi:hypothetical protein